MERCLTLNILHVMVRSGLEKHVNSRTVALFSGKVKCSSKTDAGILISLCSGIQKPLHDVLVASSCRTLKRVERESSGQVYICFSFQEEIHDVFVAVRCSICVRKRSTVPWGLPQKD